MSTERIEAVDLASGEVRLVDTAEPGVFRFDTQSTFETQTASVRRPTMKWTYLLDAELVAKLGSDDAAKFPLIDHLMRSGGPIAGWSTRSMGARIPQGELRLLSLLDPATAPPEDAAETWELVEDLLLERFPGWLRRP